MSEKKKIAIRDAFGEALKELGGINEKVVALEADVGGSTKSILFGKAYPDRYFECGISEINMVNMAAGMAREGMIPFVNTFSAFLSTRGADPISSLICYDKLNVKLCGTYVGLSDSYDGASHHAISDVAYLRSIPNMVLINPSDPVQTRAAEKYLTLIKHSDEALGEMMEYFRQVDEPVILLMFGDHQPSDYVTDVIKRLVGYDPEKSLEEAQKAYMVPYFIWNNCGLTFDVPQLTSLNYMAANILKTAGLPLTQYHEFLLDLQEELPAISAGAYVDTDGVYYSFDEKNEVFDEALNRYNILQYNHMTDISNRVTSLFGQPAADVAQ